MIPLSIDAADTLQLPRTVSHESLAVLRHTVNLEHKLALIELKAACPSEVLYQ